VGTSSLRRSAQLKSKRPDLNITPLRGNLDTRLKKLDSGMMDAIILAAAGLKRMNLENRITQYLDDTLMLPAVGQGALAIETRAGDSFVSPLVAKLDHEETRIVVGGERAFLNELEGGCQVPIAARGKTDKDKFTLTGLIASLDGTVIIRETFSGPKDEWEATGVNLARALLEKGGREILEELRKMEEEQQKSADKQ
jgi:hydroxymethylbilane synthase